MSESQFEKLLKALKEKDAENKRLRELVEASKENRKAIDELVDENKRLRGFLKEVVGDVVQAADWERLMEEIEKEVNDE